MTIAPEARAHGHLQKIQVGAPLDLVTMDVLSGLPTAADGSKYVLVVVDAFTKWVEAYALPDQEARAGRLALADLAFRRQLATWYPELVPNAQNMHIGALARVFALSISVGFSRPANTCQSNYTSRNPVGKFRLGLFSKLLQLKG